MFFLWLHVGRKTSPVRPTRVPKLRTHWRSLTFARPMPPSRDGEIWYVTRWLVLNKTDPATPLRASVPTIGKWLRALEMTGQIVFVPTHLENFGKRLRVAIPVAD